MDRSGRQYEHFLVVLSSGLAWPVRLKMYWEAGFCQWLLSAMIHPRRGRVLVSLTSTRYKPAASGAHERLLARGGPSTYTSCTRYNSA